MRIEDFDKPIDDSLPFDVVDDLAVFMRNDHMFYRKHFFPAMTKMRDMVNGKKQINPEKHFGPMIDQATKTYCIKFNIPKRPEEIMDDNDRKALLQKPYSEEMTNVRKGIY